METQQNEDMREKDFPNRRRPWTAVSLSLISPGLGQIYCGDFQSGMVIIGVIVTFSVLWIVGIMHPKTPFLPFSLMMWSIISLATVIAAIDAYRRARRIRYDYTLKEYNHWAVYLTLAWIAGAGCIGYVFNIKAIVGNYRIPQNTMAPTIVAGDRAFTNNIAYDHKNPEYGDVVVFKNPENRKTKYVKRVVALGGDTVEIKDGQLFINGKPLEREWVAEKVYEIDKKPVKGNIFWESNGGVRYQIFIADTIDDSKAQSKDFGPVTVPEYHCFVMGDNRYYSRDSRNFGSLSVGALKGRFTQIYWPLSRQASLKTSQ